MHGFGIPTLATATGGFNDTIFTSGPNWNGYLFVRLSAWESNEQNIIIRKEIKRAVQETNVVLTALYKPAKDDQVLKAYIDQTKRIMSNGLKSSWTTTFDGSISPSGKIKQAYTAALKNKKKRGKIHVDVHALRL